MTKHRTIFDTLNREIAGGKYAPGARIPSEPQLVKRFQASRPTVARALRELEHLGLIQRRAGSGTYVSPRDSTGNDCWGLIVPGLGHTEIFEPICAEIARLAQANNVVLLWGDLSHDDLEERSRMAEELCREYIARKISGLFFAPLELTEGKERVNQRITQAVRRADIPTVLLDRDLCAYPKRSDFDLVGIDNFAGGYRLAQHLLEAGCRRIHFLAKPNSAPTVDARISGIISAMTWHGIEPEAHWLRYGDPGRAPFVRALIEEGLPEAFICANDVTAAMLMRSFAEEGIRVPQEVRVAGFDDARIAQLLSVPLTTVRQPCAAIGAAAVQTLLERRRQPRMPTRQILLDVELVVRQSTLGTA